MTEKYRRQESATERERRDSGSSVAEGFRSCVILDGVRILLRHFSDELQLDHWDPLQPCDLAGLQEEVVHAPVARSPSAQVLSIEPERGVSRSRQNIE